MQVEAWRLLAIRDALVADDVQEAYHQLRAAVDPDGDVYRERGDHFAKVQDEAQATGLSPVREHELNGPDRW